VIDTTANVKMGHSPTVLVVDDEENIRMSLTELLRHEFSVLTAGSADSALEIIRKNSDKDNIRIDLVLTDISMAKMNGIELLKNIKKYNSYMEVILITAYPSTDTTLSAIKLGAMDYIVKPFNAQEVLDSVRHAIKKRNNYTKTKRMIEGLQAAIQKNYSATSDALMLTIDVKDHYTKEHSSRVAKYALQIAKSIGLALNEQELLMEIALLHDIGKIGVREDVLNKSGPLTPEEWDEMKRHPVIGYQIVQPIEFLGQMRKSLLYHHERFDGKGYPEGLTGKDIPLGARILAIADSYDAMVTDRPYRKALSIEQAIAELKKGSGRQFDPVLVREFIKIVKQKKEG